MYEYPLCPNIPVFIRNRKKNVYLITLFIFHDTFVTYEILPQIYIYPLLPNVHLNVLINVKGSKDLKAQFISVMSASMF